MRGIVTYWSKERAYGFVRTTVHPKHESFFLHEMEISEGSLVPSIGDAAEFDIAPPRIGGKLSNAVNAKITPIGGAE